MDPTIHFITVATGNLDAARSFYQRGLGWHPLVDVPGEIIFFQTGPSLVLGLYDKTAFAADLGRQPSETRIDGLTLSHNVESPGAVDRAVERMLSAGATLVTSPRHAAFGGYHGHVTDPNGVVWEIAHNPGWHVDDDGKVFLDT